MVIVEVLTTEIEMDNYERKWTWEVGGKKFVIDYLFFEGLGCRKDGNQRIWEE